MKPVHVWGMAALILGSTVFLCAAARQESSRQSVARGPLHILADETVTKDRGKSLTANGNVFIEYLLETGEKIESHSDKAHYDSATQIGLMSGSPRARWWPNRFKPKESVELLAKKIRIDVSASQLEAAGDVRVYQTSSTLKAEHVLFDDIKKSARAWGDDPEFMAQTQNEFTHIYADEIIAYTDAERIQFRNRVRGTVYLNSRRDLK